MILDEAYHVAGSVAVRSISSAVKRLLEPGDVVGEIVATVIPNIERLGASAGGQACLPGRDATHRWLIDAHRRARTLKWNEERTIESKDRQRGAISRLASSRNPSVPTLCRHRRGSPDVGATTRSEPIPYKQVAAVKLYAFTESCRPCIAFYVSQRVKPPRKKFFRVAVGPGLAESPGVLKPLAVADFASTGPIGPSAPVPPTP